VIVTDGRQPGMLHVDDVMEAAESSHLQRLQDLQAQLSFDDPINIQFTSVGGRSNCLATGLGVGVGVRGWG